VGKEIVSMELSGYAETVGRCMESAGAEKVISDGRPVMLKPNLVTASPFPVTTSPLFCEAVIEFIRRYTDASIVIAEGCGDATMETPEVFARLGYEDLSKRFSIELLDLNRLPLKRLTNPSCSVLKKMWLPEMVFDHVLISLPVLKAHSLCRFSGSMKNMMGLLPPEHYSGRYGIWKKAAFHNRLDEKIMDLNHYRSPDFTVMDATIGLADYHLGGTHCEPPVNRILAGPDARALDREAAGLLGMNWRDIFHLA